MWKTCGKVAAAWEFGGSSGVLINRSHSASNRDQRQERGTQPLDRGLQGSACSGVVVMQRSCSCRLSCPL
jgi:hypothetical protein